MTAIEISGCLLGVLSVWLLARLKVANWPLGLVANLLFAVAFSRAGLYADAGLQIVFTALAGYGWWSWTHGGGPGHALPVRHVRRTEGVRSALACAVMTALLTCVLLRFTDSTVPFWDAALTTMSLLALWGQAGRVLESWLLWLVADVVHVPLYAAKGLWPTALLYAVLAALCVVGLREWRQAVPVPARPAAPEVPAAPPAPEEEALK
ncbi:nicotinamide riboside transporter PnuC [Streptomyces sp. NPDC051561]|uniref:nicotinamide riboside transporter PnuC n=1 Tax=Streptomyces sp. NPDC051561 TaxID=3365658 RepID=UPI00379161E4